MTATQTTEVVEVSIKMRLGKAEDFKVEVNELNNEGFLEEKIKPKYGQPYWLKSEVDGTFDNRNYQITEDMDKDDWDEFRDYLRKEMVYVPLSYFELLELNK